MPARPLHAMWRQSNVPPVEWFIGDIDVVHGTNFVVPPTHRAGAVVSVHDLTPVHYPELCNEATLAYPGLIRRAIGRGAWVHTDSSFIADEVAAAFAIERDRVVTVHPGVPQLPEVSPEKAENIVQHLLPAGSGPFVLSVGTAEPRKDLPGLVRAFDAVASAEPDALLVLAGPSGWGEATLTAAIEGSKFASRIVRTGWVTPTELAALTGHASVLAYPSIYEGFGFPPLQAMAAGLPVVATRAGSLPEVLGDGAVMVDVGDHDALAHALIQLLGNDAVRQRAIDAGRVQAAKYEWDACAEGLEALYRRVHGERRG
jgi:glycosyltransferase involved in cell wall biosynthesis